MNRGDVFILVSPKYIYIWTGSKSNRMERTAAIRVANELKNENSRFKLSVIVCDDGKEISQLSGDESVIFDRYLSFESKDAQMVKYSEGFDWTASDENFETTEREYVKLYRCHEKRDQIDIKYVKDGPLTRADLDSSV